MTRLEFAIEQIRQARQYTCRLIETVDHADWFRIPPAGVTHVAWQVGHLAMAHYVLCLERIRGTRPEDGNLIPEDLRARFGRGSVPDADPAKNPTPEEVRAIFDRVYRQTLEELPDLSDQELDRPPHRPHPQFSTKYGALTWAARHEMLHAGQIGLLRRQLGASPIR